MTTDDDDNTLRWIIREPARQNRVESRREKFPSIQRGCDIATKMIKKTHFSASSFSITMTQYECLLTYLLMGHFLHSSLLFFFSIRFFLFFTRVYQGWWRPPLSLCLTVVVPRTTTISYAYLGSEYHEKRRKKNIRTENIIIGQTKKEGKKGGRKKKRISLYIT